MNRIYPQVWVHLPKEVREHLAKVFNISRSGVTEIRDQEVVSDGYTIADLGVITLEKMNEYIGSEETFARAWEITLAKVNSELNPPAATIRTTEEEITIEEELEGETVIIEEKTVTFHDDAPITKEDIKDVEPPIDSEGPWCDTCDSKGGRHKKWCPKIQKHDTETTEEK